MSSSWLDFPFCVSTNSSLIMDAVCVCVCNPATTSSGRIFRYIIPKSIGIDERMMARAQPVDCVYENLSVCVYTEERRVRLCFETERDWIFLNDGEKERRKGEKNVVGGRVERKRIMRIKRMRKQRGVCSWSERACRYGHIPRQRFGAGCANRTNHIRDH